MLHCIAVRLLHLALQNTVTCYVTMFDLMLFLFLIFHVHPTRKGVCCAATLHILGMVYYNSRDGAYAVCGLWIYTPFRAA